MPKNAQGEVVCINQGTSINGGSSVHQMAKAPGTGIISKSGSGPDGQPMIDRGQGLTIDIHICLNCKYIETYVNPDA